MRGGRGRRDQKMRGAVCQVSRASDSMVVCSGFLAKYGDSHFILTSGAVLSGSSKDYVARFDYVDDKDFGFDVNFRGNIQTYPRLNAALLSYIGGEK
eukprot:TRINITY_DN7105_c0_g1_i1.p1 TRINITY_DN7105_c0_g1~~TRINITY_DN7105_c0_g1_i1.p1  ORF type:complete len:97 (+),score=18.17 TRINITY_DN7105_c0_g1_i1:115-405(+)